MQDKRNIENVVQEIMTLIDGYAASASTNLHMLIESKLRELVENSFYVREPLSDEEVQGIFDKHYEEYYSGKIQEISIFTFTRTIERAHGITNTIGVK